MLSRSNQLIVVFMLLATTGGCSRQNGLVNATGRLTYKGKPVPSTYVIFQPVEAGKHASHGLTDDDGKFKLTYSRTETGVLLGAHRVSLKYHVSGEEELRTAPPKASKELKAVIARFADPNSSGLKYDIQDDDQVIEIHLE